MARNVEIKARATDFEMQSALARDLGDERVEHLVQKDTFFDVLNGRLKLREFGDGAGELIQYHREDRAGPKESRYLRVVVDDPATLAEALTNALGVRAVVQKQRTVYFCGRTRIHLDRVAGLGEFIELEVVLEPGERVADGVAIAEALMVTLRIRAEDLVETGYVDLLAERSLEARGGE